jgi:hypothetical protein
MKNLILSLCIVFSLTNINAEIVPHEINGTLEDAISGVELNPFLGDYCIVVINDFSGQTYALLSDEGVEGPVCDDAYRLQDKLGQEVQANGGDLSVVFDNDLIEEVRSYIGVPSAIVLSSDGNLVSNE